MISKMKEMACFQHPNIRILGYTREVSKLMDVSDVLITKPGGMTCTEALAKGLPMLFIPPLPGQEEENCEYFVQAGYGQVIHSADVITTRFRELCDQTKAPNEAESQLKVVRKPWNKPSYDPTSCAHELLCPAAAGPPRPRNASRPEFLPRRCQVPEFHSKASKGPWSSSKRVLNVDRHVL